VPGYPAAATHAEGAEGVHPGGAAAAPHIKPVGAPQTESGAAPGCGIQGINVNAPEPASASPRRRVIKLYEIPVAAGSGVFLDSSSYDDFEADETVPDETDFAVKVSGDSMTPRFVDSQIIFIRAQQLLDVGEIGIFSLNGDSYVKKLGHGELLSLNRKYSPIPIGEYDAFYIFGKVVG